MKNSYNSATHKIVAKKWELKANRITNVNPCIIWEKMGQRQRIAKQPKENNTFENEWLLLMQGTNIRWSSSLLI